MSCVIRVPACRIRRLTAVMLVAWLNLMAQSALAAAEVVPAGMEHCHHAGDCPEMKPVACAADNGFNIESQRFTGAPRAAPLLVLLPAEAPGQTHLSPLAYTLRPPITGPPLTIRFCHLRN